MTAGVGEKTAQLLSVHFGSLDALEHATEQELLLVPGIGYGLAHSILTWFSIPSNRNILRKLKKAGIWPTCSAILAPADTALPLDSKRFVITGALPSMTRQQATSYIEKRGGSVSNKVTSKTDYLLLGEKPGSKFSDAKGHGTTIISEPELYQLAGDQ